MTLVLNVFGYDIAKLSFHPHATMAGEATITNVAERAVQATTHHWIRFMVPKRGR